MVFEYCKAEFLLVIKLNLKTIFQKLIILKIKKYDILKNELSEFIIFINSGGVNSDIFKISLKQ